MGDITDKFGLNAGKIWNALNTHGQLNQSSLIKNTKLSLKDFYAGIGWLARENKICRDGLYYKLGQTNLTDKIGQDAGKIWQLLNSQGEVDISTISKTTQIKLQDAYSALGWLAREDKIFGTKLKRNSDQLKFKLK